jgi:hypothetical protein
MVQRVMECYILAFSDLHGNASTLKLLRDNIRDKSYPRRIEKFVYKAQM